MTKAPPTDADSTVHSRIRQQEVVAELGQQALETGDLEQLMRDAARDDTDRERRGRDDSGASPEKFRIGL